MDSDLVSKIEVPRLRFLTIERGEGIAKHYNDFDATIMGCKNQGELLYCFYVSESQNPSFPRCPKGIFPMTKKSLR